MHWMKSNLLCAILLLNGCAVMAEQTNELQQKNIPTLKATPGAVITNEWYIEIDGTIEKFNGEWIHIPSGEAVQFLSE